MAYHTYFRFIRSLSSEHFTYMATRQLSGDTTVNELQWPWRYFKVIRLFHIKFLINGVWYGKSYYRLLGLIWNYTLAFDWCHFWWPWMIFEGHFTLSRPISRKLCRVRPHKLKLLIRNQTFAFKWYECLWPWRHFKVIKLFYIKFLVNGALYGKFATEY